MLGDTQKNIQSVTGIHCQQKSRAQIKKLIFSCILPNPVNPVSIWPEPDRNQNVA